MYDKSDSRPVTWTFAGLVVVALVVLAVMRHAYGVITIEGGTRLCRSGFGARRAGGSG